MIGRDVQLWVARPSGDDWAGQETSPELVVSPYPLWGGLPTAPPAEPESAQIENPIRSPS